MPETLRDTMTEIQVLHRECKIVRASHDSWKLQFIIIKGIINSCSNVRVCGHKHISIFILSSVAVDCGKCLCNKKKYAVPGIWPWYLKPSRYFYSKKGKMSQKGYMFYNNMVLNMNCKKMVGCNMVLRDYRFQDILYLI